MDGSFTMLESCDSIAFMLPCPNFPIEVEGEGRPSLSLANTADGDSGFLRE